MAFADRLLEEIQQVDDGPDMALLCRAIGAMFQQIEDLAGDRTVTRTNSHLIAYGLFPSSALFPTPSLYSVAGEIEYEWDEEAPGYSLLLDIDNIPAEWLGYLGQFVGVNLLPGLNDDEQRSWVRSCNGFVRGRPATIKNAVQQTLTGTKHVTLLERTGSGDDEAWVHTVITRPDETPDSAATLAAIQAAKPGPDIINHNASYLASYGWVKDNVPTYGDLKDTYASYLNLKNQEA